MLMVGIRYGLAVFLTMIGSSIKAERSSKSLHDLEAAAFPLSTLVMM